MESQKLLDAIVNHNKFGEGIIKEVDDKYLIIEFGSGKVSKFSYPGCFDKFLTFKDKRKQNAIEKDVAVWREESGEALRNEMRLKYQKTQDAIEARRKTAKEKKLLAAQRSQAMREQRMTRNNKKN